MERERWEILCHLAGKLANRSSRSPFSDDVICAVYWWAVVHDRPVGWACQASHWPADCQQRLPSQPTMSRRLRSAAIEQLLADIEETLLALVVVAGPRVLVVDGKPLTVSVEPAQTLMRLGVVGPAAWSKVTSCTRYGAQVRYPSPGDWRP